MRNRGWMLALALAVLPCCVSAQTTPSFDCTQKLTSSVEQRICKDPKLAELDRQMADAYAAALAKTTAVDAQALANAQRTWLKMRNDCWKDSAVPACVETAFHNRISDLQARYRLMEPVGTAHYLCPGPPPQEAIADYFATEPPTAMVQFAGATQLMRVAPSGSGARYKGGNRQLWEHQDVAMINWGATTPELRCPKK